jgi:hypothetical protein
LRVLAARRFGVNVMARVSTTEFSTQLPYRSVVVPCDADVRFRPLFAEQLQARGTDAHVFTQWLEEIESAEYVRTVIRYAGVAAAAMPAGFAFPPLLYVSERYLRFLCGFELEPLDDLVQLPGGDLEWETLAESQTQLRPDAGPPVLGRVPGMFQVDGSKRLAGSMLSELQHASAGSRTSLSVPMLLLLLDDEYEALVLRRAKRMLEWPLHTPLQLGNDMLHPSSLLDRDVVVFASSVADVTTALRCTIAGVCLLAFSSASGCILLHLLALDCIHLSESMWCCFFIACDGRQQAKCHSGYMPQCRSVSSSGGVSNVRSGLRI